MIPSLKRMVLCLGIVGLLLGPAAPTLAQTTEVIQQCLCEIQQEGELASKSEIFVGNEWLGDSDTVTPEQQCQEFCLLHSGEEGASFISATYGEHESTTTPVVKPILGVDIPNLKFSDAKKEGGTLSVNFIGEYIVAIYNWLLGVAVVFAVIMVMVGGVQYMLAGGSPTGVKEAQKRITQALIGVVLLLGSYTLLSTANPQLTLFRGVQIPVVEGVPAETLVTGPIGNSNALCGSVEDCRLFCDDRDAAPQKTSGMAAPNQVEAITSDLDNGLRVIKPESLLPSTKQKLEAAGRIAKERGYTIVVADAYRSLAEQLELACREIRRADKEGGKPRIPSAVAWPGTSSHGTGTAVDIRLGNASGTSLWNVKFSTQRSANLEDVKTLAEIMYAAGWQRYHKEIWHFQTDTGSCTSNQCFSYPHDDGCTCE